MIDYEQAKEIALRKIGPNCGLVEESTVEKPYGWYFVGQSLAWIKSRDMMDMLVGSGGFIVERKSGQTIEFGSAYSTERWLEEYESGFLTNTFKLTIHKVFDLHMTVRLLRKLNLTYVVSEIQDGVEWRVVKHYSDGQLKEQLAHLPIQLPEQHFRFCGEIFESMRTSACCAFTLVASEIGDEEGLQERANKGSRAAFENALSKVTSTTLPSAEDRLS